MTAVPRRGRSPQTAGRSQSAGDDDRGDLQTPSVTTVEDDFSDDGTPPFHGDPPGIKRKYTFRIALHQVGNLGVTKNESKDQAMSLAIRQNKVDCVLAQELGVRFDFMDHQGQLRARLAKYLDGSLLRCATANNKNDPQRTAHQWGGTAVVSYGP